MFGENFPYTNFHDLNMDWIIKIAKDFLDQYTHIQDIISQGEADIAEMTQEGLTSLDEKKIELENLLQEWYNTHSNDIANQLAEALDDIAEELSDSLEDISSALQTAITDFDTHAEQKAQQTIASIPEDYTALSNLVNTINTWALIGHGTIRNATFTDDNVLMEIPVGVYSVIADSTIAQYLPAGFATTGTMVVGRSTDGYGFALYEDTNGRTAMRQGYNLNEGANVGWNTGWNILSEFADHGQITITDDNYLMTLDEGTYEVANVSNTPYLPVGFQPYGIILVFKTTHYYNEVVYLDTDGRIGTRPYYTINNVNTWHGGWTKVGNYPANQVDLASVINLDTIFEGTFTLNSEVTLNENHHIIGNNATVVCGANAKINMSNNSSISGFKFTGSWNPNRQVGDGTTSSQYAYVPIISETDLATGDTDALFGTNRTKTDSLIYIAQNKGWNTKVSDCIFAFFDQPVIYAGGKRHFDLENPIICNNYFVYCRTDIIVDGEFERIYGNIHYGGCVGTYMIMGNTNNFGEIYKCMDCGFYYPDSNGGHNEITSVEIAHCGVAGIYLVELSTDLGAQITGCQIVDAPIIGAPVGKIVDNLDISSSRIDTYIAFGTARRINMCLCNVGQGYLYGHNLVTATDIQMKLNRAIGAGHADSEVNN